MTHFKDRILQNVIRRNTSGGTPDELIRFAQNVGIDRDNAIRAIVELYREGKILVGQRGGEYPYLVLLGAEFDTAARASHPPQ